MVSAIPTSQIPLFQREKQLTHETSLSFQRGKSMYAKMEKLVFLLWGSHPEMDDNYKSGGDRPTAGIHPAFSEYTARLGIDGI